MASIDPSFVCGPATPILSAFPAVSETLRPDTALAPRRTATPIQSPTRTAEANGSVVEVIVPASFDAFWTSAMAGGGGATGVETVNVCDVGLRGSNTADAGSVTSSSVELTNTAGRGVAS